MRILGITTEGDSGAAVVEDGRILSAINEERLSRLKLVVGFPRGAITAALRLANTDVSQLDAVLIAGERDLFADQLQPFDGWFQQKSHGAGEFIKRHIAHRFARYGNSIPALQSMYYAALGPSFYYRRRRIRQILRQEFGIGCPIQFVDHHFAHVTSAYYTSGFRDALIVSADGGGDGLSALIYSNVDGRFTKLHEVSAFNSLGNYYAYVTHICGFKAQKHEGKITGLAAHGEPKYRDLLNEFITYEDGTFRNVGAVAFLGAIEELKRRLPSGWTREDLAASIQVHCEDLIRKLVQHWARQSGLRDVAMAGGVFANVRINQEVHELPEVDRVFIHPHMGDGGLSVGAALAACVPNTLPRTMPCDGRPLPDAYLGTPISTAEIDAALERHSLKPEPLDQPLEDQIAELLTTGHVIARVDGRMEYGPRALGNRTILYQPTDRSVNDWLNVRLRRTEFMPFAPAVLYEYREMCFENFEGAEHAAEFMTITFQCTDWCRSAMKGVVHVDGTARPQLVRAECNPGFYRIIQAFHARTGLPAVINTSFNMHEEPIVCTADDALRAFLEGEIDYIALGPYLIKHPKGITHALTAVTRSENSLPR